VGGMICTLSKSQVTKLKRLYGKQLSGTITKEKLVYISLPCDLNEDVDVQDILGNSLGKITVKEAWNL
jgi:hypothetical protein